MKVMVRLFDERFYKDYSDNWDDKLFRNLILRHLQKETRCLDYGAGRGNVREMQFDEQVNFIAGVDVDPAVFENKHISEAKLISLPDNSIQYPDSAFDLVFSDNVMEHVDRPELVLAEIGRVLKQDGLLLFKTPNKNHYMPLVSRFTPTWFHKFYNRLRGRDEVDTFPVRYKLNTVKDVKKYAEAAGFEVLGIQLNEGRPEYLRISVFTYIFGILYERLVNSSILFSRFRCVLIAVLKKR